MLVNLIVLAVVGATGYWTYTKFISPKLDSPQNNQAVKGLEKSEIKATIKENETKLKTLKEEIKAIEQERKTILKSEDADKADKAQEKLEAKEEKIKELTKLEIDLEDLKIVEKGGWKAMMPNKLTLNNGLWLGGFLLAMGFLWKLCVGIFRSIFRNTGMQE